MTEERIPQSETLDPNTSDTDDLADLGGASPEDVRAAAMAYRPEEFADEFEQLSTDAQREMLRTAPDVITPDILDALEDEVVEDILPLLPADQLAEAITELDNDDATQIVEEMDDLQREAVLAALDPGERADLEAALAFDEETIGRLMQRDFVAAPPYWTVGDTIDHMRATGDELPELFFNIYVVDEAVRPVGYVPVSQIMRRPRAEVLRDIMEPSPILITEEMDQEDAAYLFEKYHLISAPVVNAAGRITGMMQVDDIIDIIQDENTEDIYALAGVSDGGLTDTALSTVKARAPWLLVNLGTAVLASLVIAQFEDALAQIIALAILMPIVASMGGNAGTQALTVAVRGLSERELTPKTAWRAIRREAVAALMIGLIFAVVMACVTLVWFDNGQLALVIFLAMIVNHICAGIAGITIPLVLKRFGADPAVASTVFVTTITDVVGFLAFLGIAVLMLL